MDELKKCPFCGKDMQSHALASGEHIIWCKNCGAQGPNELNLKDAERMWNLRRPEEAQAAEIARLREALEVLAYGGWPKMAKWLEKNVPGVKCYSDIQYRQAIARAALQEPQP